MNFPLIVLLPCRCRAFFAFYWQKDSMGEILAHELGNAEHFARRISKAPFIATTFHMSLKPLVCRLKCLRDIYTLYVSVSRRYHVFYDFRQIHLSSLSLLSLLFPEHHKQSHGMGFLVNSTSLIPGFFSTLCKFMMSSF